MQSLPMSPSRITLIVFALTSSWGCRGGMDDYVSNVLAKPSQWASGLTSPSRALADKRQAARLPRDEVPSPDLNEKNYASVQLAMGESFEKEGNLASAESAYSAAIRNDPQMARAHHRLALVMEKRGKGLESQEHMLNATQLDPKNAEIASDMGYWCYLRRDWRQAEHYLKHALQLDPGLERAANNLGLVYARTNRSEEAMRLFATAGLNVSEARTNLGFVLMTEQRLTEARAQFEQALAADPRAEKAQQALAALQTVQQKCLTLEREPHHEVPVSAHDPMRIVSRPARTVTEMANEPYRALTRAHPSPLTQPMQSTQEIVSGSFPHDEATHAWSPTVVDPATANVEISRTQATLNKRASEPSGSVWRPIQLLSAVLPWATSEHETTQSGLVASESHTFGSKPLSFRPIDSFEANPLAMTTPAHTISSPEADLPLMGPTPALSYEDLPTDDSGAPLMVVCDADNSEGPTNQPDVHFGVTRSTTESASSTSRAPSPTPAKVRASSDTSLLRASASRQSVGFAEIEADPIQFAR